MARLFFLLIFVCVVRPQSTQGPNVADPCSDPNTPRPPTVVCPVGYGAGGVSGVIAASSFPSCTAFQGVLNCGDVQNVTVLDLGLNGGTGQSVSYDFSVVPSPGSDLNDIIGNDCTASGGCGVNSGGRVRVTVTISQIILFYDLVDVSLEVPYAYTSFHSNAYHIYTPSDNPDFCGAASTSSSSPPYYSGGTSSGGMDFPYKHGTGTPLQADTDEPDGIPWSYTGSFVTTNTPCILPVTDNSDLYFQRALTWPSVSGAFFYQSNSNGFKGGSDTITYVSDEFGAASPNNFRFTCDMPRANDHQSTFSEDVSEPCAAGTDCTARSALCMFYNTNGFTASFDGDASWDRANKEIEGETINCADQTDDDDCRLGTGSCSGSFGHLRPVHCRQEVDDDCDDGDWNNCMKKFQMMRTNQPCRMYYGNHFYVGRTDAYHYLMNDFQNYCYPVDSSTSKTAADDPTNELLSYGTAGEIRPVIIGCGAGPPPAKAGYVTPPYFPYGLPPIVPIVKDNTVNFDNTNKDYLNYYAPQRLGSNGEHYEDDTEGQYNACGPDDDFCCQADIFHEDFTGPDSVPMVVCTPAIDQKAELSNPDCPTNANPKHCPLCSTDRQGLDANGDLYYTASSMGKIGPFNYVFDIRPAANPVFSATATMVNLDSDGNVASTISSVTITNVVLETGQTTNQKITKVQQSGLVGSKATDSKNIMFLEIVGIDTTTGTVGPDLDGYIVVVNETSTVSGGSRVLYQGDVTKGGLENPWTVSNPFGNGGITPWPDFLNLDDKNGTSNTKGAWWYYVPADKKKQYGTGCGKLGIKNSFFADNFNAQRICSSDRNTCVPGFYPGFDWDIRDRLNELFNSDVPVSERGQKELKLRDDLAVHTPCVVSSYFHEWMSTSTDCSDFINKVNTQRYLPPKWVLDSNTAKCDTPQYWMFGNRLFYSDQDVNSNTLYVRMRLAVAGQLLNVDQQVSGGCFSKTGAMADEFDACLQDDNPPTINDVQCAVVQNENSGSITVNVLNTGGLTGDYIIFTNCSSQSGIVAIANPVFELDRNSPAREVTIPIQHSGTVPVDPTCSLTLSHPQFTFAVFWRLNDIACLVAQQTTGSPVSINVTAADTCKQYGIGCNVTTQGDDSSDLVWIYLAVALTVMIILTVCCLCTMDMCQKDSIAESRQQKDVASMKQALSSYK